LSRVSGKASVVRDAGGTAGQRGIRRQRVPRVPRSSCGTDVIEQTTLFGSKLVATWRVSELGR